jgi:hypothetical protein
VICISSRNAAVQALDFDFAEDNPQKRECDQRNRRYAEKHADDEYSLFHAQSPPNPGKLPRSFSTQFAAL